MPLSWKLLPFKEIGRYADREDTEEQTPLQISAYERTKANLLQAIAEADCDAFQKALEKEFIYRIGEKTHPKIYKGNFHTKFSYEKYCLARPSIEAIFFDKKFDLQRILQALEGKTQLQKTFVSVCMGSRSIPQKVFKPLESANLVVEWVKLCAQYFTADEVHSLNQCLISMERNPDDCFSQLVKKLEFLKILHSKDDTIARDKNYRCIVVNIAMILLGFVPNLFLWLATDNFLFFKQTYAQENIARIDAQVSLFRPHAIPCSLQRCPEDDESYHENLPLNSAPDIDFNSGYTLVGMQS